MRQAGNVERWLNIDLVPVQQKAGANHQAGWSLFGIRLALWAWVALRIDPSGKERSEVVAPVVQSALPLSAFSTAVIDIIQSLSPQVHCRSAQLPPGK